MACVYILYSEKSLKYYVGSTVNLDNRLNQHNNGNGGKYTKIHRPWKLICIRNFTNIREARAEEKRIKSYKGGNAFKKIIRGEVAEWSKAAHC